MRCMTIPDSSLVGEGRAFALVPAPSQPWYMSPLAIPDRRALEDEHTRILARAVGDHLPYELALRAQAVAEQLQR
jgi:hypothetical protein